MDNSEASVLGVSLSLSPDASIDTIAFSTTTDVFYLTLRGSALASNHSNRALTRLFTGKSCPLVGFGMARLAMQLYRQFGVPVEGVDLSTLFTSTDAPWTAAEFVTKRVDPDAPTRRIHALWCHNEVRDVYSRAWLSALCVCTVCLYLFFDIR